MNIVEAIRKAGPDAFIRHPEYLGGRAIWTGTMHDTDNCVMALGSCFTSCSEKFHGQETQTTPVGR